MGSGYFKKHQEPMVFMKEPAVLEAVIWFCCVFFFWNWESWLCDLLISWEPQLGNLKTHWGFVSIFDNRPTQVHTTNYKRFNYYHIVHGQLQHMCAKWLIHFEDSIPKKKNILKKDFIFHAQKCAFQNVFFRGRVIFLQFSAVIKII